MRYEPAAVPDRPEQRPAGHEHGLAEPLGEQVPDLVHVVEHPVDHARRSVGERVPEPLPLVDHQWSPVDVGQVGAGRRVAEDGGRTGGRTGVHDPQVHPEPAGETVAQHSGPRLEPEALHIPVLEEQLGGHRLCGLSEGPDPASVHQDVDRALTRLVDREQHALLRRVHVPDRTHALTR